MTQTTPKTTPAPLLNIDETAATLNCSPKNIRRLIESGDLPHIRIGRLIRIRPDDLDRFIRVRKY